MQQLRNRMLSFFENLWPAEHKTLVFGEGRTEQPPIMLIGEAPGEQETLQRRPFVGKAGKNLDGFLAAVGLERPEIYISNVVKIRPTKVSPKGSVSNRPPNREELMLFTPWLYEEILLAQPRRIVTLGNVALKALMGRDAVIGEYHGRSVTAEITHGGRTQRFEVFPLYHPASIIYNRALTEVYAEDLHRLRQMLDGVN
ncbi:MAG: uracil-DNA glycosylase [Clostridia bacterium]|nr:uracil-DNA glycosylase [Clostridia bacterium]